MLELSYEIEKLKSYWRDIIINLKSPEGKIDLAYIWTDEVKKDFEGIKTEAGKIAFFLKKLHLRYKTNEQKYYKEISHIKILLLNLNKLKADAVWLKEIRMELEDVIRDVEKFKNIAVEGETVTYNIAPKSALILRRGSIADHIGDGIFFLNLSSTHFPALGPVVRAFCDKDAQLPKPHRSVSMLDTIQEYTLAIPDSQIVLEGDIFSGLEYRTAQFNRPRPYETYAMDVQKVKWPKLKYLIFGNIGNVSDGIVVHVWQPIKEQFQKLYKELDYLIKGVLEQSSVLNIQDLAMPVLTGNNASSEFFYTQLVKTLNNTKKSVLPKRLTIFAYSEEDYKNGYTILNQNFKHK